MDTGYKTSLTHTHDYSKYPLVMRLLLQLLFLLSLASSRQCGNWSGYYCRDPKPFRTQYVISKDTCAERCSGANGWRGKCEYWTWNRRTLKCYLFNTCYGFGYRGGAWVTGKVCRSTTPTPTPPTTPKDCSKY